MIRVSSQIKRTRIDRKAVEARLRALPKLRAKVGVQGEDASVQRGTDKHSFTMVQMAYAHEFVIGPRPFLRPSLADNTEHTKRQLRAMAKTAWSGKDAKPIAIELAEHLGEAAQKHLFDLRAPPLSDAYRRQRILRSDDANPNPLYDTGALHKAISGKVVVV